MCHENVNFSIIREQKHFKKSGVSQYKVEYYYQHLPVGVPSFIWEDLMGPAQSWHYDWVLPKHCNSEHEAYCWRSLNKNSELSIWFCFSTTWAPDSSPTVFSWWFFKNTKLCSSKWVHMFTFPSPSPNRSEQICNATTCTTWNFATA